jgi:hypothetical protein
MYSFFQIQPLNGKGSERQKSERRK